MVKDASWTGVGIISYVFSEASELQSINSFIYKCYDIYPLYIMISFEILLLFLFMFQTFILCEQNFVNLHHQLREPGAPVLDLFA